VTHIPLTGFDRLDYAAWCAFKDCPKEFPLLVSSVWLKLLDTSAGVNGPRISRADISVRTAHAGSQGGAGANAAMSVSPAAGTLIGHLTGRVISTRNTSFSAPGQ
jgi:hypothetical protein